MFSGSKNNSVSHNLFFSVCFLFLLPLANVMYLSVVIVKVRIVSQLGIVFGLRLVSSLFPMITIMEVTCTGCSLVLFFGLTTMLVVRHGLAQ